MKLMNQVWEADLGHASRKLVMLALADNANDKGECWPGLDNIARRTGLHRTTVSKTIKNLEASGLLSHLPGKGRKSSHYTLNLSRSGSATPTQGGSEANPQSTVVVAPDQPRVGEKPTQSGSDANAGLVSDHRSVGLTPTKPSGTTIEPPLNQPQTPFGDLEEMIEWISKIYQAYPRKVGKPAAIRAIRKAMKGSSPELLLTKTEAYARAREGQPDKFTPHPATWFNQERFNDDPVTWATNRAQEETEFSNAF